MEKLSRIFFVLKTKTGRMILWMILVGINFSKKHDITTWSFFVELASIFFPNKRRGEQHGFSWCFFHALKLKRKAFEAYWIWLMVSLLVCFLLIGGVSQTKKWQKSSIFTKTGDNSTQFISSLNGCCFKKSLSEIVVLTKKQFLYTKNCYFHPNLNKTERLKFSMNSRCWRYTLHQINRSKKEGSHRLLGDEKSWQMKVSRLGSPNY